MLAWKKEILPAIPSRIPLKYTIEVINRKYSKGHDRQPKEYPMKPEIVRKKKARKD